MATYVPGTLEGDQKKVIMSLQQIGPRLDTAVADIAAKTGANPTATIGLTAVNGVAGTYVRSDGAPALSQAIAPTWTALHTYTLNSGGWKSSGTPNQSGTYRGGVTEKWGIIADATAAASSSNSPESTMIVNMTTAVGVSDPVNSFKTAFGASCLANTGSADAWAQANVMELGPGNGRGGVVLELDLNNHCGFTSPTTPGTPYRGNLILAGQNTDGVTTHAIADFALGIQFAQNSDPMWNYGVYMGPSGFTPFNVAAIFDESDSTYGYLLKGTKTTGIDMSNCTTSNAIFVDNNSAIISYNSARNTVLNLLKADGSNNIVLGQSSGVAQITAASHVIPESDNVYTVGKSGTRWSAIWAANGTIQTSDRRAKTDIEDLPPALPIVEAVSPKSYRWTSGDGKRHWGLIAQDLDAAIEKTGVEFAGINKDDPDRWGLNYAETNAILWQGVRELKAEIDELKAEIKKLKQMPWHGC